MAQLNKKNGLVISFHHNNMVKNLKSNGTIFLTLPQLSGRGRVSRSLELKIEKLFQHAINKYEKKIYIISINLRFINNKNH